MTQNNRLSNREWEVVELLLQGKSNKLIAGALGISVRTVEFHLKNIYTKFQVSSRVELILILGNATGKAEIKELGSSTVDSSVKSAENKDTPKPRKDWAASFRDAISIIGKELQMKNLLNSKHVLTGVIAALMAGFLWVALLRRFGHVSLEAILPWLPPLIVLLAIIGFSVGLTGKRNGNSLLNIFFSALIGTGLGSFVMLPLVAIVVYPLAKLAEWLGLVNRAAISNDIASALLYVAMMVIWLIVGTAVGAMLLFITVKRQKQADIQGHVPEHGLQ